MWWRRPDSYMRSSQLYQGMRLLGTIERSDSGWVFRSFFGVPAILIPEILIPGTEFMDIDEAEVVALAYLRMTGMLRWNQEG